MRASLGHRSNCNRPARAWGWVVLLCLLVLIGAVFDLQHDTSTHAQSMQVVEVAQSVEDRSDIDAGRLVSCHANVAYEQPKITKLACAKCDILLHLPRLACHCVAYLWVAKNLLRSGLNARLS